MALIDDENSFPVEAPSIVCPCCGVELRIELTIDEAAAAARETPPPIGILRRPLSPRETSVLTALMQGYRVSQIAERHSISVHTVRKHLHGLYEKTGARSQPELVAWARSGSR